ncbi:MAG TPA: PEGA domain-containing protein [Thermoanaerobaculia bacterium]|nr:PEGA domain-containing protein [Thermoanaerobaculia bacterium]
MLGPLPALAQVEQSDLDVETSPVPPELTQLFDQAVEMFGTVDQADSIPLFTQLIQDLEPLVGIGGEEVVRLLTESLSRRAAAHFNFGDTELAQADLRRLIELDPGYSLDTSMASRKLVELFDEAREELVGDVRFLIDPADARVLLNNEPLEDASGQPALMAGTYLARIERPGYEPVETELDVVAGELITLEQTLERTSAVLALRTRPPGARITIDGAPRGETAGQAAPSYRPTGPAASYPPSDFSQELLIAGLAPGSHRLEVTRPGFRSWQGEIDVDGLEDFVVPPILLEREAGTLVLGALPSDATVELDGRSMRPTRGDDGTSQLVVSPGSYLLTIRRSTGDFFETSVDVADREIATVDVELRPALILLGVLGGDEVGAKQLSQRIVDAISLDGHWSPLDRSSQAAPLLADLGLDAESLRRLSGRAAGGPPSIDWAGVQSAIAEDLRGGAYVLGVLSDDLLATEADLWIWPTPPGPPTPERRTLPLGDDAALARLADGFAPVLRRNRPVLGALVFDSAAGEGPVIGHLTPRGPAAEAGLRVGDQVTTFAGAPMFSAAQLEEQLLKAEPGETVQVEARNAQEGMRTVELVIGASLDIVRLNDPNVVYPAVAARLASELSQQSDWPRWVLLVNQAALQLRSGDTEGAVRTLRSIESGSVPPGTAGLGQATIDYLLGLALTGTGPRYAELAKEAFQRAADAGQGRLFHDDGPFVAPRALAHLGALGAQSP